MLSLKNVNAIAHFTDWIVAHVHVGALGWNGMLTFWYHLLADPKDIQYAIVFKETRGQPLLAGYTGHRFLRRSHVLGRVYPKQYVEAVH